MIAPIHIDYGGITPVDGDHVVVPVGEWADIAYAIGTALEARSHHPAIKRAGEAVGRRHPVVRFGGTQGAV